MNDSIFSAQPKARWRRTLVLLALAVLSSPVAAQDYSIFSNSRIGFGDGQSREIRSTVTFPEFGANDKLTFNWGLLGDQDPWDRAGSIHLILPDSKQVQLGKFVTGFNGTTTHSQDVSNLAAMLSGKTVTVEAHIDTWVIDAWRLNASLNVQQGVQPKANPDWALPAIPNESGLGWHDSGDLTRNYTVITPNNLKDVKLTYFASGHHHTQTSNSDEFNQRRHSLYVDNQLVWTGIPWRTDGRNFRSVNPTSGRWDGNGDGDTNDPYPIDQWSSDFPRSGWVPGDEVHPYVLDVTEYLTAANRHQVRLVIEDVDINSYWRVSGYLSGTLVDPPELTGDFNRDGAVDAADYTVWRDQYNRTGLALAADANNDGRVNLIDRGIWATNYGRGSGPFSTAVPEPATITLLALAALGYRRR
ncbi:peptide-N-glycosidase F-related protein [Botrimarina mediterranea]|uniref:Peptide-N-glycosidase F N-terminal domain-containing protein n=1 Tax=Botrimarina mediterranea TaxID=2528022 RepID=A0A518K4Y4_9BACT|nr:peptide-N-glycosidase F-related protein [Botrimarina mediterranea]QDV72852.1 hypothetical protein Spa11_10350 [Botrimarina mediterranea]QDV77424.1 hypothetical protein K2D_10160 [Planctomycetes bacterium K2D]